MPERGVVVAAVDAGRVVGVAAVGAAFEGGALSLLIRLRF